MAQPQQNLTTEGEEIRDLSAHSGRLFNISCAVAVVALVIAVVLGAAMENGLQYLSFAYLTNYAFFLSLSMGALFFVLATHLFRAGWCATVRRIPEIMAANLGLMAVLFIPIGLLALYSVNKGTDSAVVLYRWALPKDFLHDHDHLTYEKYQYLNVGFFWVRWVAYFAIWIWLARGFWKRSVAQDSSPDPALSTYRQSLAAPGVFLFALTITFASFDLIMSLDPHWFSTIFGVYYFAGGFSSAMAAVIVITLYMNRFGILSKSITADHYHDMGKLMFAFIVFWAYIGFSQYMLIWYANIPEETSWFHRRQVGGVHPDGSPNWGGWAILGFALVFGKFFVPFLGVMSRHVKRCKPALMFWAFWLLLFQYLDMYWLVMPELQASADSIHPEVEHAAATFDPKALWFSVVCLFALGGIYVAGLVKIAGRRSLIAVNDPRMNESLAFENM